MTLSLFLPAAGFGSRLTPLTNHIPKPLIPIAGIPAIDRILLHAYSSLSIDKIVINTHHLPHQINDWAQAHQLSSKMHLLHEPTILGTGGALSNAKDLLQDSTTLVLNSDVLSSMDLAALYSHHKTTGNDVTLAVYHFDATKTVGVDKDGYLVCVGRDNDPQGKVVQWVGYACAALYEPSFVALLPEGNSHVVSAWLNARDAELRIGTFDIGECYWRDIGLLEDFYTANYEYLTALQRPYHLVEPLQLPSSTVLQGWGSIDANVRVSENTIFKNTIVISGAYLDAAHLDAAYLDADTTYEGKIIGPDFVVPKEGSFTLTPSPHRPPVDFYPQDEFSKGLGTIDFLGSGGGDRRYYRTQKGLVACSFPGDSEVAHQVEHTTFFKDAGLRVPAIYKWDTLNNRLLIQDLGDTTLYALQQDTPQNILQAYKDTLDQLFILHSLNPADCTKLDSRCMDYDMLCWESSYFQERCLEGLFAQKASPQLEADFATLAREVAQLPTGIIHRDCQSQNIMMHDGAVWLIDFQGARRGPILYDIASLVLDPYVDISAQYDELVAYYYDKLKTAHHPAAHHFKRNLALCGIQRHLQALGAYGFLSKVKGKKEYLTYVPVALAYLQQELDQVAGEFEHLEKVVARLVTMTL